MVIVVMKQLHKILTLSLAVLPAPFSCQSSRDRLQVDVSSVRVQPVKIHRYDLDLFRINPSEIQSGLEKLQPEYRFFLEADLHDTANLNQIQLYLGNRRNVEFHEAVMTQFKDLNGLESDLTEMFRHFKYYYPQYQLPRVYSYISGGDYSQPVRFADSVLLIGLDNFLGKDFPAYQADGLPRYLTERMTPGHLLPKVVKAAGSQLLPQNQGANVMELMINTGKEVYFVRAMIPAVDPALILEYERAQYEWITKNEGAVWSALIENQLLYSSDGRIMRSFFSDAPYSTDFSPEAPPRLGAWLGYRIVNQYMENHPEVTLQTLMAETDLQKIFTGSRFKPSK